MLKFTRSTMQPAAPFRMKIDDYKSTTSALEKTQTPFNFAHTENKRCLGLQTTNVTVIHPKKHKVDDCFPIN